MLFVAFFYYQNEKRLYFDLVKSNMQNKISDISSKIILTHMTNTTIDVSKFTNLKDYKISFYDNNRVKLFGNFDFDLNLDFENKSNRTNDNFVLIDDSVLGHLGIYYIAIEENIFYKQKKELEVNIFIMFMIIFLIISVVGFYLVQLFIKPIKDERVKLNNFIKNTTHELNTPISAILMSTENDVLSKNQISRVRLATKRILDIYKDLTYIFLENNHFVKHVDKFDLSKLIEEEIVYFEPLVLRKKINLNLNINNFNYLINKDDFVRLFNNILSNAIKYNKTKGNIYIILTKNGLLSVEDTGIGIKKSFKNDIFNRYFRATNLQGGFGLGLNVVKSVCTQYNIKINVNSTYKKGTKFSFQF